MRATRFAVLGCWVGALISVLSTLRLSGPGVLGSLAVVAGLALVPLALGTVLALRAPEHPAGPLVAVAGTVATATLLPLPVLGGGWVLLYVPFALVLLTVPDHRPAGRRWWPVAAMLILSAVVFAVLFGLDVLGVWHLPVTAERALVGVFGVSLLVCALAPVARYRHADPVTRLRLRWILLAAFSVPGTLLLCWASYLLLGVPDLVAVGLLVMYLAVPVAATLAVLRPTVADVDGLVVAVGSATAACVVVLLGLTVIRLGSGDTIGQLPPTAVVVVTIACTLLGVLAYRHFARILGRLIRPERARTLRELAELGRLVEAGRADPEEVEDVLRTCLGDPALSIGYRGLVDPALRTRSGTPLATGTSTVPIRHRGAEVGLLAYSPTRTRPPSAGVVHAAAPLVEAARVRLELARARTEVEGSRERILRAGYEERRRLERDLHDGAQQRLVALGLQLRVLQRTPGVSASTVDSLDAAVAEVGTAVAELRSIAQGVRPRALDDGLPAALADLVQTVPARVDLDIRVGDLPDATATTAYYVVSEAVTNALRYADADTIAVRLHAADDELWIRISDDGIGGAQLRPRGGLAGLTDRVAGLGGSLTLDSPVGAGTAVEVRLPCGS